MGGKQQTWPRSNPPGETPSPPPPGFSGVTAKHRFLGSWDGSGLAPHCLGQPGTIHNHASPAAGRARLLTRQLDIPKPAKGLGESGPVRPLAPAHLFTRFIRGIPNCQHPGTLGALVRASPGLISPPKQPLRTRTPTAGRDGHAVTPPRSQTVPSLGQTTYLRKTQQNPPALAPRCTKLGQ